MSLNWGLLKAKAPAWQYQFEEEDKIGPKGPPGLFLCKNLCKSLNETLYVGVSIIRRTADRDSSDLEIHWDTNTLEQQIMKTNFKKNQLHC